MNWKMLRESMIAAMGYTCKRCGKKFKSGQLIIHHIGFDKGKPLGYQSKKRYETLKEFAMTGKIPKDVVLLCVSCNRRHHRYKPSFEEIFADRLRRIREDEEKTDERFKSLADEEKAEYEHDFKRYMKAYPYLMEPVGVDLLKEALFLKILIKRKSKIVLESSQPEELLATQKLLESLIRTLALLFARLGITYTGKVKRKEPKTVVKPFEDEEGR